MTCHICKQDHSYKNCPNKHQVFKFRNNRWLTTGLFLEYYRDGGNTPKEKVIYTAMPYEVEGYPSLQNLYLSYNDMTEYSFAKECLGGWDHWQTILSSGNERLLDAIASWRAELEAKIKFEAFERIKNEAEADGRNGFAANRYLIERSWAGDFSRPKPKEEAKKRGRPKKQEDHSYEIAQAAKQINRDFDRLFLKTNNGTDQEGSNPTASPE